MNCKSASALLGILFLTLCTPYSTEATTATASASSSSSSGSSTSTSTATASAGSVSVSTSTSGSAVAYAGASLSGVTISTSSGVTIPYVSSSDTSSAFSVASTSRQQVHSLESYQQYHNMMLGVHQVGFKNNAIRQVSTSATAKAETAETLLAASVAIAQAKSLSKAQATFGLASVSVSVGSIPNYSVVYNVPQCNTYSKYRTYDGSCNNLNHPTWGQAEIPFRRLAFPDYADGLTSPRVAVDNTALPSARLISDKCTTDIDVNNNDYTMSVAFWGQFVDHDITIAPIVTGASAIKCCQPAGTTLHEACFPINVSPNDPFYNTYGVTCMEFVRSAAAPRRDYLGYREQMNQITAYMDASNVYGSSGAEAANLRLGTGGLLKTSLDPVDSSRRLLPTHDDPTCELKQAAQKCFFAGDERVNEQPNLALLHTVWLREHNRCAVALKSINPSWSDEKLYQESRRIVAAQMQHITYNEWLPIILGPSYTAANDIDPKTTGYSTSYRTDIDASIANAFSAAAFRFGHSLIKGIIQRITDSNTNAGDVILHKKFFNPHLIYNKNHFNQLVRSMAKQQLPAVDNSFTTDLTQQLFPEDGGFGMDLVTLNVQRGRDHGIPGYYKYKSICGLGEVNSWDDLKTHISDQNVSLLQSVYSSPKDVDLFIGGVMETPTGGALVGPTFRCIIGDQFRRLKIGDRFFYEYGNSSYTRFTSAQLQEIRKSSLARILCDNSENLSKIQPRVFFDQSVSGNQRRLCTSYGYIPKLDLTKWSV